MKVFVSGSMRTPKVQKVAIALREHGFNVVDDWHSSGPESDDYWQIYERNRGRTYAEAAYGLHSRHVFEFDYNHLMTSDAMVIVYPAGKSAHTEMAWFGGYYYALSQVWPAEFGKPRPAYILIDEEPERYDIMPPQFAELTGGGVVTSVDELVQRLKP